MKIDPIHQFNIEPLFTIGHIGNHTIAFTNSSLYMFITVALISLLMIGSMARGQLVPGRMQSIAEISYEFVATTIRSTAGAEGMKFFPLIFSLFMFICVSNLVGVIPYTFTVSTHIVVTAALARRLVQEFLAGETTGGATLDAPPPTGPATPVSAPRAVGRPATDQASEGYSSMSSAKG